MKFSASINVHIVITNKKMNEIENIKPPPLPKRKAKDLNWKWLVLIIAPCVLLIVALIVARGFIYKPFKIPTGSMQPTLIPGDHIICNKTVSGEDAKRGDVIVFYYPEDKRKVFTSRVAALPGASVEVKQHKLFINGEYIEEDYISLTDEKTDSRLGNFGPINVPDNSIFVLGDNRNKSFDSRYWGFVDYKDVIGKITYIYWSQDSESFKVRWDRIGMAVK